MGDWDVRVELFAVTLQTTLLAIKNNFNTYVAIIACVGQMLFFALLHSNTNITERQK